MAGEFYIEAVENTTIQLTKNGSPTVGTVTYGINTSPSTTYTLNTSVSLTAGQKMYWAITSTSTNFSTRNFLIFTSTGKINVGGDIKSLIGGNSSIPRNYCFASLFVNCTNLIDASALDLDVTFGSKTYCFYRMFYNCTGLKNPPSLPALTLGSYCYSNMFNGCTNLKLSATETGNYTIPYRIPKTGTGTAGSNSFTSMFSGTGGTFKSDPTINTTYYLWDWSAIVTGIVSITYNNTVLASTEETMPCDIKYDGTVIGTIDLNQTKTLTCNGKLMTGNVDVGSKKLLTIAKVMLSDVTVTAS